MHRITQVYLEGQLETRKWETKEGGDRYTTEVVLRPFKGEITMLDSKPGAGSSEAVPDHSSPPSRSMDELEDEIPF